MSVVVRQNRCLFALYVLLSVHSVLGPLSLLRPPVQVKLVEYVAVGAQGPSCDAGPEGLVHAVLDCNATDDVPIRVLPRLYPTVVLCCPN